jgi:hypothetical protein
VVIGQDLQSGTYDEQHEERVREMLELQPPWKSGIDRRRRLRDAGMALNECRYVQKLAQALRERDQAKQRRRYDRQRPQGFEPASPDPDVGKIPCCGGIQWLRRMRSFASLRLAWSGSNDGGFVLVSAGDHFLLSIAAWPRPQLRSLVSAEPLWNAMCSLLLLLISYCGASALA